MNRVWRVAFHLTVPKWGAPDHDSKGLVSWGTVLTFPPTNSLLWCFVSWILTKIKVWHAYSYTKGVCVSIFGIQYAILYGILIQLPGIQFWTERKLIYSGKVHFIEMLNLTSAYVSTRFNPKTMDLAKTILQWQSSSSMPHTHKMCIENLSWCKLSLTE